MSAKFTITANFGDYTATCEGGSQKEVFEALADASEILRFHLCGNCGGKTVHTVRRPGEYIYHEVTCRECKWVHKFGVPKKDQSRLYANETEGWQKGFDHGTKNPKPQRDDF